MVLCKTACDLHMVEVDYSSDCLQTKRQRVIVFLFTSQS